MLHAYLHSFYRQKQRNIIDNTDKKIDIKKRISYAQWNTDNRYVILHNVEKHQYQRYVYNTIHPTYVGGLIIIICQCAHVLVINFAT